MASIYMNANGNARFLTAYYNYDQSWPDQLECQTSHANTDLLDNATDLTAVTARIELLRNKAAQIKQLREQIKANQTLMEKSAARVNKLIASSKWELPSVDCPFDESKAYLDLAKQWQRSRLENDRQTLAHLDFTRAQLSSLRNYFTGLDQGSHQQSTDKINKCLRQWIAQRLGVLSLSADDSHIMLRLEPSMPETVSEQPIALIRCVKRRNCLGHLLLTDLEVVSAKRADYADLARCASASLAPSVLVARLLYDLHIDRCIQNDIQRLRSQYALDWDPANRQLHVLCGHKGNLVATLSIAPDGSLSIERLRFKELNTSELEGSKFTVEYLDSRLKEFTAPLSSSLDEWIMETEDFCRTISTDEND